MMNAQASKFLFRSWSLLLVIFLASAYALWAADPALQAAQEARPARGVRILSPQDGSTIRPQGEEAGPVPHPVVGDVYGFDQAEIRKFDLTVDVSILTNQSYPQGLVKVRDNGTWRLPTAWFGGSRHIVRAVLKDGNGNEIHSHEISVTVVH